MNLLYKLMLKGGGVASTITRTYAQISGGLVGPIDTARTANRTYLLASNNTALVLYIKGTQDEVFGPVLAIVPAESDEHAVAIANNSDYGLSGAVWGGDDDRALRVAARIRTGQVEVNGGRYNPAAPFGGYKRSGIGRELGHHGIDDMLEIKAVQR